MHLNNIFLNYPGVNRSSVCGFVTELSCVGVHRTNFRYGLPALTATVRIRITTRLNTEQNNLGLIPAIITTRALHIVTVYKACGYFKIN